MWFVWRVSRFAPDSCFDIPVWLIRGDEDFVGIVLSESREIYQKTMLIWHDDLDLVDLRYFFESVFSHCIERLLDGLTVVICEGAEQSLAKANAYAVKWKIRGDVAPRRANCGAKEPVFCLGQRCQRV